MLQTITSTVVPVAVTALIAVLVALIKGVGDATVNFIEQKTAAVKAKMGADTYTHNLAIARSIWGIVDEEARTNPNFQKIIGDVTARIQAKQTLFTEKIREAIPDITDEEINQLRQAVAGEVNKGKAAMESIPEGYEQTDAAELETAVTDTTQAGTTDQATAAAVPVPNGAAQ